MPSVVSLCKQLRPRSGPKICRACSGYELFGTPIAFLKYSLKTEQFKKHIRKQQNVGNITQHAKSLTFLKKPIWKCTGLKQPRKTILSLIAATKQNRSVIILPPRFLCSRTIQLFVQEQSQYTVKNKCYL